MQVLILQLKRIGDAILTTPVITALRKGAPGCVITLALDAGTASLAEALGADLVLVRGKNFWRGIAGGGFDVCLDLSGNDRSALATFVSRARRRITWSRFAHKPLRRAIYNEFVDSSVKERHTADHHTDLLRPLGIEIENVPTALHLPDFARSEAAQELARAGMPETFAVVHAGTARPEKYWNAERWAEVIDHLRFERGWPVVLTGSHDAEERRHLAEILPHLSSASTPQVVNLAGRLSLLGTAALIRRARLLVGVDSAPVHIADALGTPLVVLFGPTNPLHWRPRRSTAGVVTPSAPPSEKKRMEDISVEMVLREIERF